MRGKTAMLSSGFLAFTVAAVRGSTDCSVCQPCPFWWSHPVSSDSLSSSLMHSSCALQFCMHGWHHPLQRERLSLPAFTRGAFFIQRLPGQQAQTSWGWQCCIHDKYNLSVNCQVFWHCWVSLLPHCSHILGVPSSKRNGMWKYKRH